MKTNHLKKEIVYTLKYETEEDIQKAEALQSRLYEKYNAVYVYPNGLYEVRIVASSSPDSHSPPQ